jgi:hypothetical protein
MTEVLEKGNVRERMLALGKFMEMIGKDAMSETGRAKIASAGFTDGDDRRYSAADAKLLVERALAYQTANPSSKDSDKDVTNMFKPTKDEKFGRHAEYADAKGQDMDTKLPAMVADKVNEFLGKKLANDPKAMVQKGEENPLARTTITVREAIAEGLALSDREIAAAGGLDGKLNWVVGQTANIVDPNAKFIKQAKDSSMPLKAGISGTTYRWMEVVELLGGNPELARLAAIASLQAADAHSFHEIATAAKGFGVNYDSSHPYANTGLDDALLQQLAVTAGTSLDELNGAKPSAKP